MAESSDEWFAFEDEAPAGALTGEGAPALAWKVLVVDDDADVHQATVFALQDVSVFGRPLRFFHAHNVAQARQLLLEHNDLALVLLDVVMETESAGLDLVDFIRNEAGLSATRIVLRTGQPGYAPEHDTILRYDINDYKTKSELTRHKLLTTVTTAIRSFQQVGAIEAQRSGLELIVRSGADFMEEVGTRGFALGVITQLAALLGVPANGLVCGQVQAGAQGPSALAATGRWAGMQDWPLERLPDAGLRAQLVQALQQCDVVWSAAGVAVYAGDRHGSAMVVFVDIPPHAQPADRSLLDVFAFNIGNLLRNRHLLQRLHAAAFDDPLVGLPNRASFVEALDRRIAAGASGHALALVDIDDFSATNDVMGHRFGDQLLVAMARRLRERLPPQTVLARIGSDIFGVLGDQADVHPEALMAAARLPLEIEGMAHKPSITCGYVLLQSDASAGVDLLKDASMALKRAKKDHRGHYVTFSAHLGAEARSRARLLSELRAAFEAEKLFLAYQPQVDLGSGELIGLEALIRWRTDGGSFVPPDQFIPVAERSGLMAALGQWVLSSACTCMRELLDLGLAPRRMAVNVSVVQLQDLAFAEHVHQALAGAGLQGQHLELEVTESVAVLPTAYLVSTLAGLRSDGVTIAIDDFGTGYSSLSYLERLPLDRIKIDRTFVRQIRQAQGPRIAEMVTQLGHKLGLEVLAEGIEDAEVLAALRSIGCHAGQGYHMARPMDRQALLPWLRQHHQRVT